MGRRLEYEVKTSVRLNMSNPQHVKINDVIQNLDPKIFKSKNQFIIDAIQFYIDNYGKETFVIKKKEKERAEYIRSEDIDDIKEEVIEAATNEARKEVIRLLGGVISGMNVGQPVIMQVANSEAQEPTEDVMDDTPRRARAVRSHFYNTGIQVHLNKMSMEWFIENKSMDKHSVAATKTYGTSRI